MSPRKKDKLFTKPYPSAKFEFNAPVAKVFDDMLERSVPLYKECQNLVLDITSIYARPKTSVIDLGCSTGTLLLKLAKRLPKSVRLIGVDNSADMLKRAKRKLKAHASRTELIEADLNDAIQHDSVSVVIMNYTLQFLPPNKRGPMAKRIFKNLQPGGAFILIEKVLGETEALDQEFVNLHHRFKEERGYSRMEIARKRKSLDKVLIPMPPGKTTAMLKRAGFSDVDLFFKWANFAGWLALKPHTKTKRPRVK